jgi:uncharacterized phage protein (TIGR01671 family)
MMSREIKFRAWDIELGFMVDPDYYFVMFDGSIWFNNCADGEDDLTEQTFKLKIMQYTGLKDKNGKEIYEGDILNNIEAVDIAWRQVVEFETGAFWRKDISKGDDSQWEFDGWETVGEDWEVIGNIYENPELLEGHAD